MSRLHLPSATSPADKINSGLLVRRLVLGLNTSRSVELSDQPLSANASICRRDSDGTLASDFLWQYTAAAFTHMAEVTGMLITPRIDRPTLAALRQLSVVS